MEYCHLFFIPRPNSFNLNTFKKMKTKICVTRENCIRISFMSAYNRIKKIRCIKKMFGCYTFLNFFPLHSYLWNFFVDCASTDFWIISHFNSQPFKCDFQLSICINHWLNKESEISNMHIKSDETESKQI